MNKVLVNCSLIFVVIIILSSCGKEGGCLKSAGKETSIYRTLTSFDSIVAEDAFEIVLHQDSQYSATITGGENLIPNIGLTVSDNTLYLSNNNKCDWMKPRHNKIRLNISFATLRKMTVRSSCKIRTDNAISGEEFGMVLMDKVQDVDLQLDVNTFFYWNNPPCGGEMRLSGQCKNLKIWNWALIAIDAKNLEAQNVLVYSNSIGDISVKASEYLDCSIMHRGDVIYYGNPAQIVLHDEGEGELIKGD